MIRAALACCFLVTAAPAAAATVVREVPPAAGPALVGEELVWGEQAADGTLQLLRGRPGEEPRRLLELPPPERDDQRNYFGGVPGNLAASASTIAFALGRDTCTRDGDSIGCSGTVEALTGGPEGPFAPLVAACETGGYVSVDVEGDRVAAALSYTSCDGRHGTEVWVRDGAAQPRPVYRRGSRRLAAIAQVKLAGGLVGWTEDRSNGVQRTLVVQELRTGRERLRIGARRFLGRRTSFEGFDLAADGTVVAVGGGRNPRCRSCVAWLRLGDRRPRVLSRRGWGRHVAISGRNVAFATDRRLLVSTLGGKRVATLDRFHRARRPAGEIVLDGRRAAWGVVYSEARDGQTLTATF